jgi:hypothetical protein
MEAMAGFSASNRSRNHLDGLSNCSSKECHYRRRRRAGGIFCSKTLETHVHVYCQCTTVQTILLGCILILRLPVGLSRWFASHSSSCPQTLLFAWCNPQFPSNLAVCPPVLWKVFPFNSHKAAGSVSIS